MDASALFVTTTTLGYVRAEVSAYLADLASRGALVSYPVHRPYENALNHAACLFRKSGRDYWLNIDADNPPRGDVAGLVSLGMDVIGCPTPIYRPHKYGLTIWNVFQRGIDGYNPAITRGVGMERCDAIGSGCFLVAKRVIDRILKPFERSVDSWGRVVKGLDIRFCEIAHAHGFEVFAHWDYVCHHWNEVDLLELAEWQPPVNLSSSVAPEVAEVAQ